MINVFFVFDFSLGVWNENYRLKPQSLLIFSSIIV
jgi:hypothetical protein